VTITRGAKTIEFWREVVKKRWNPEIQFLNLEVRFLLLITLSGAYLLLLSTVLDRR
jgi:hypothetical protein